MGTLWVGHGYLTGGLWVSYGHLMGGPSAPNKWVMGGLWVGHGHLTGGLWVGHGHLRGSYRSVNHKHFTGDIATSDIIFAFTIVGREHAFSVY